MIIGRRIAALLSIASLLSVSACGGGNPPAAAFIAPPSETQLLQQKIHHVFIIQQENHSFDNYFGTFPGANGFAKATSAQLSQQDPADGVVVKPFKLTDPDGVGPDQDRQVLETKFDGGKMDKFVVGEYNDEAQAYNNGDQGVGTDTEEDALQTMGFYDCDTIPYLWSYAKNFNLYDNYFQADTGQSTLGNVQLFSAQIGQTQYAAHPSMEQAGGTYSATGVPLNSDENPAWGPGGSGGYTNVPTNDIAANFGDYQIDLNFATMGLMLGGTSDTALASSTFNGNPNAADIQQDFSAVGASGRTPIQWFWAQERWANVYPSGTDKKYVAHHNAPQYFGYIYNSPSLISQVIDTDGATGLLSKIQGGQLASSGVYYIKGSKENPNGWQPANAANAGKFLGDDDHPGSSNSDHEIAEAWLANVVNTIASSQYWQDSVIIVTWDDPGGYFDHVTPPTFAENCPDAACGDGERLPLMIISPYAQTGVVLHDINDTNSISKLIETVFNLPTLSSLPFEAKYGGAGDGRSMIGNLTSAFDINKLNGTTPPVPASMAMIPAGYLSMFWNPTAAGAPATGPMSCKTLGITPVTTNTTTVTPANWVPAYRIRFAHPNREPDRDD
jgi:phospholipase C